jgi:hypothetical protein
VDPALGNAGDEEGEPGQGEGPWGPHLCKMSSLLEALLGPPWRCLTAVVTGNMASLWEESCASLLGSRCLHRVNFLNSEI